MRLEDIIGLMRPDEKTALLNGYASAQREGYGGDLPSFFRDQAELYRTAHEGDPRLKTYLYGDTFDRYMRSRTGIALSALRQVGGFGD